MVSHNVSITQFSELVSSLSADTNNNHSAFLKPLGTVLFKVVHHFESLGAMIYYWHYLSYDMLEHIGLGLNLDGIQPEFQKFKEDIQAFRRQTTMAAFSQTEKMKRVCPPLYSELVTQFLWSETDTLQRLEEFRLDYLRNYQLHGYSMILGFVEMMESSFTVTWFIPQVVIASLGSPLPEEFATQYSAVIHIDNNKNLASVAASNDIIEGLIKVWFWFLLILCITFPFYSKDQKFQKNLCTFLLASIVCLMFCVLIAVRYYVIVVSVKI